MGGSWTAVFWAGFVASILAACAFWVFRTFGWTLFSPTSQLGCLIFDDPRLPMTETVGVGLFLALGTTVVALAHAWLLALFGGPGWGTGILAGLLHGAATTAALPWLARLSRCVRQGRLPQPGRFGLDWGRATPAAVVAGHVVYGGILGAVLAAF